MSGRRSRVKGSTGEREFFKLSNDMVADLEWPYRDRQGQVFFRHPAPRHGKGQPDNSDPHGVLPVTIEVKRVEKPQFKRWIEKLLDQTREHQTPVLAWRQNQKPWLVMPLMDETEWREYLRWKLTKDK
jgi:Holliday junction resolvase